MKDSQTEEKPATVSGSSRQAGEIRARWPWVEPSVWTERMLTALEKGVKGGKWFSVIHQRWPNAFFAEHGLFSFVAAHVEVCRSSRR